MDDYQLLMDKYQIIGEVISLCDNKQRSIGQKRTDLIGLATGKYIVMTDDDKDRLTRRYFENIEKAMDSDSDVITYFQFARINEDYTFVDFGLNYPNEYQKHMGHTKRPAWHCCTWKREVVKDIKFADINYGEDDLFSRLANERAKTEFKIPHICHVYEHDSHLTAAFL